MPAETSVHLVDAHRLLSLFAEGIAGRYFHLKPLDALRAGFERDALRAGFRPDVLSPPPPTSEGLFIYLPEQLDELPEARANFGLYRVAVMHQLGFLEFGTYAFELSEARRRVPALAGREPAAGRTYRSDFELFFACSDAPDLARQLFALFEDDRIDGRLRHVYPGLSSDLDRAMALALTRRAPLAAIDSPAGLLEALLRCTLGADADALSAVDSTGLLAPLLEALAVVREPGADVYTSAAAALGCVELLRAAVVARGETHAESDDAPLDAVEPTLPPVDFRGRAGFELAQQRLRVEATDALLETLEETGDALSDDALERLAAAGGLELEGRPGQGTGGGAPGVGARAPVTGANVQTLADALARRSQSDRSALRAVFGDVSRAQQSFLYDEWDFHSRSYLRGWCRLYEEQLRGDEGAGFLESVHKRHADLLAQVRRRFQHVQPESYRRVGRVREGEDVDLDSAVEAHVDRRAGLAPDDRVYMRRERARREVAAAFLVDLSGSVSQVLVDPDAPPAEIPDDDGYLWSLPDPTAPASPERRILDVEKEALALMVQALETLGDEYAIYGFSGSGRENVEFYVAKEFETPLGLPVWNAIAAMRPHGSTRMGPAIRHTVAKLQRQSASRKVLLLISDGFPQDIDYGPDRGDHDYGIHDTAQALREAERAGIQTFCTTVDAAGNDYLRTMCPDHQYLVIDEVELLPAELGKVYRALTRRG
jgi:hypothetical protein